MNPGRFYLLIAMLIILTTICHERAEAFWGFGDDRNVGKSGLDLERGYDINTVTTVTGRVVSILNPGERDNVMIEINSVNETVTLCVGPALYWDKHGIRINHNDIIEATGSKAQGKDGKIFLLTQKITNQTTGARAVPRSDKGDPAWMGKNSSNTRTERSSGRVGRQGNRMMRGNSGMIRR